MAEDERELRLLLLAAELALEAEDLLLRDDELPGELGDDADEDEAELLLAELDDALLDAEDDDADDELAEAEEAEEDEEAELLLEADDDRLLDDDPLLLLDDAELELPLLDELLDDVDDDDDELSLTDAEALAEL